MHNFEHSKDRRAVVRYSDLAVASLDEFIHASRAQCAVQHLYNLLAGVDVGYDLPDTL